MPAFLTHWHVLIETARRSQDAGSDLGSLIIDARAHPPERSGRLVLYLRSAFSSLEVISLPWLTWEPWLLI